MESPRDMILEVLAHFSELEPDLIFRYAAITKDNIMVSHLVTDPDDDEVVSIVHCYMGHDLSLDEQFVVVSEAEDAEFLSHAREHYFTVNLQQIRLLLHWV